MFRAISRRLALLNALVVIGVIAAVGLASYLYLARKIETQTDAELRNRSASAVQLWTDVFLAADARTAAVARRRSMHAIRTMMTTTTMTRPASSRPRSWFEAVTPSPTESTSG